MSNPYAPKYKPDMPGIIIAEMSKGACLVEVAVALGVSRNTIYRWIKDGGEFYIKEIAEAIEEGKDLSESWWLKEGRSSLRDKDFNSTLWYMNMKNRHGWRDKHEVEANVDSSITIELVRFGENTPTS